jgi:hypothetical protein
LRRIWHTRYFESTSTPIMFTCQPPVCGLSCYQGVPTLHIDNQTL